MSKQRILFVNHNMNIGGNVTSMISWLNCIDLDKYDVDLLLYKNEGDLLPFIPEGIRLLPQAFNCEGRFGTLKKYAKSFFSNYLLKAYLANRKRGKHSFSSQMMAECQARLLSRKLDTEYDYAVGFFEGWADRYVADIVVAKHKYGWYHSMFKEICPISELELHWLNKVEIVATVSQQAYEHFCETLPSMSHKARYYKNILSTALIRNRAEDEDVNDKAYCDFVNADCMKIVTVCRLDVSSKALERAVFAAKRLFDEGYRFVWYIIGDGADRDYLQDLIDKNQLGKVIILIGKRINPYPFVKNADLFCLTSRYEGKPMVITEAMMLGTPPIVTEYASARDQITHGVDGRIAANDDVSIYYELKYCLDFPDKIEKMSAYLKDNEYGNEAYADYLQAELFSEP